MPEFTQRQWLGLGLMGFSLLPLGYSLGWLDWLFHGGVPTPGGRLFVRGEGDCGGFPDRGRVWVTDVNGQAVSGALVFVAVNNGSTIPEGGAFRYIGTSDLNGGGPMHSWSFWETGWFYAEHPQWGRSNVVGVCL